jgi:PAS domain S-box-containing protein
MVAASDQSQPDSSSYLQNILDSPEHSDLRRLTSLVEHLFRVPVAYMALLGTGDAVVARIGNGTEYAACLGAVRLDNLLARPQLVRDSARDLPPGTDLADLRFAASALLRSSSGVQFGVLVIADRVPRPEFSTADLDALADLAGVLAGKMELRMIASLALETELSLRETEQRFRGIANCAPVPLIYSRADGSCLFVNQTWLDFSGRTAGQELASGWVSLIHPDHRRAVVKECRRALDAQRPFTVKAPLRRRDGQYRWTLGKGAPRFRADGSFAGYVGCLIDIADYRATPEMHTCGAVRCPCGRLCPLPEGERTIAP